MPASNHSPNGTVQAIQYTGSNASEILAVLGGNWRCFTELSGNRITFAQLNNEGIGLSPNIMHPNDWLVSQSSAITNTTPALSAGFSVMSNGQFTQQYT